MEKVITYAKFRYHSLTDPRPKFGTYGPYSQYKLRFIHTLDLRREIDRGHDKYILSSPLYFILGRPVPNLKEK